MITLVGVGHVFDLKDQIRRIILDRRPGVVCIELDRGRFEAMLQGEPRGSAPFSYRILALMQRFIASKYDVQLGQEMLAAAATAREVGARLAFIDMDAELFYRKVMGSMRFEERMKLLAGVLSGFLVRKKRIEKELKNFEENEQEYIKTFEKEFPAMKKVLIDDRNAYMAGAIRTIHRDHPDLVAVIGDGHVEGIRALISDLGPEVVRLRELRGTAAAVPASGGKEKNASVSYSFEVR